MCLAFCTLYVERGATPALHVELQITPGILTHCTLDVQEDAPRVLRASGLVSAKVSCSCVPYIRS